MTSPVGGATAVPAPLQALLTLLDADPENRALLADTAEAALDARRGDMAAELLHRSARLGPLPPRETNMAGLAALEAHDFAAAAEAFQVLFDSGAHEIGVRFNLAWARANLKQFDEALDVLDDVTAQALGQGAMLRVQLLHQLGRFEEAGDSARHYIVLHPEHRGLMAAVSVLALDINDEALAAACAAEAGDHPDALATRGTLALGDDHATAALELFERALSADAGSPRAWVGLGLAKLMTGQNATAGPDIDRGAEMFGDHLGSWIAAGWAYFVAGDAATAHARFETALALDPNFAETHGSLAVLDVLAGNVEAARKRSDVALRLDRHCYSAALARSLLASSAGDHATARRIFDHAANHSVDGSGRTIGQALARMGLGNAKA